MSRMGWRSSLSIAVASLGILVLVSLLCLPWSHYRDIYVLRYATGQSTRAFALQRVGARARAGDSSSMLLIREVSVSTNSYDRLLAIKILWECDMSSWEAAVVTAARDSGFKMREEMWEWVVNLGMAGSYGDIVDLGVEERVDMFSRWRAQ